MKFLKKYRIYLIFGALSAAFCTYYLYHSLHQLAQELIHFKQATAEFELYKNEPKFEQYKQKLAQYYASGTYENEVSKITQKAKNYFATLPIKQNSAVVFDVDDTAVYNFAKMEKFEFIWANRNDLMQARANGMDMMPPIIPVLDLYKALLDKGYKIIFLTSRNEEQYEKTEKELKNAGYTTYEKLILMPDPIAFNRSIKTADWKRDMRKMIWQTYDIAGSVGDRDSDFEGGYTGYKVKLPNYLY